MKSTWNPERLKSLLKKLRGKKILVIGDLGVDRYTIGAVERISPEAPVPIVRVEEEKLKLGLAANVADNVRALGGEVLLTGVIGKDRCAEDFKNLLRLAKISAQSLILDPTRRTVLKERIVSDRQQLLRVDYETLKPVSARVVSDLRRKISLLIPKCDAVILEDYAKGLISENLARAVFQSAHDAGKRVTVDPNLKSPAEFYEGASVLTPNTREAEHLAGKKITDKKSLIEVGRLILRRTQAEHVVITRGKEGMALFSQSVGDVQIIPTYAREVYDVSGAGDTVIALLTLALSAGGSIYEAAILANIAAGVEVGKRGTATVSPREIIEAIGNLNSIH